MNEIVVLSIAAAGGVLLGAIFFGGLWWTVKKGLSSEHAALWFVGSLILRMGVVVLGFYLVSQRDWRSLLACLFGFVASKLAITLLLPKKGGNS